MGEPGEPRVNLKRTGSPQNQMLWRGLTEFGEPGEPLLKPSVRARACARRRLKQVHKVHRFTREGGQSEERRWDEEEDTRRTAEGRRADC